MPSSISLSNLSWSAPDGTSVLNDITLTFGPERTGIIGRNGSGKSTLLRLIAGDLRPSSGRVHLAGTASWMRQDVLHNPEDTVADLLGIKAGLDLLDRAEAGLASTSDLTDADWTLPARVEAVLARCGLSVDPRTPLLALSGGQRTRAALAAMIVSEPDVLLLDEPTNNLDREGRDALADLLRGWTKGALIVSHDRELLEEMEAIVELTPLGAARYGGNYCAFRQRKETERAAAERDLLDAEKAVDQAAQRAQQALERKARRDGAGHRARAKGDQPKILLDAKKGRAEASGGAGARLRDARRTMMEEQVTAARRRMEILQPISMEIASTGLAPGKAVLVAEALTGGHDPRQPIIKDLSFTLTGGRRVVIRGPNGSGKTTLLRLITGAVIPASGRATIMVPYALLDQHVGLLWPHQTLKDNFSRLNPSADANAVHAVLARFGFRALDALRLADQLSGGERLRAGLACTLGGLPPPLLLILDEPTNHLDLDGLTALEAALSDYDGAILAISHDEAFIRALAPDTTIDLKP